MNRLTNTLLCVVVAFLAIPSKTLFGDGASSSPVAYLQVSFPSLNTGYVTAEKGSAYWLEATRNGGSAWYPRQLPFSIDPSPPPGPPSIFSATMQFQNKSLGWIAGYNPNHCTSGQTPDEVNCQTSVFATGDAGKSWAAILTVPQGQTINNLQLVSTKVGWVITSTCETTTGGQTVCGYDQTVHETTDGGTTWRTPAWADGYISQLLWNTPTTGWMAIGSGPGSTRCSSTLFHTRDGGDKWKEILHLTRQCNMTVSFDSAKDGLLMTASSAGCDSGGCPEEVRRTTDGGFHWAKQSEPKTWTGTKGFVVSTGLVDSQHGFLAFALGNNLRTEGGVATTTNGGKSWHRSYPCYSVGPGGATAPNVRVIWFTGSWVSYCSQARGTGLFRSFDWGHHWSQITTGL